MKSITERIKKNLQDGTLFKNGFIALRNRFIKNVITSNTIYFLNKARVITKKYQQNINKIDSYGFKVGNYYLDKRIAITNQSIVYSLGILAEISFDQYLQHHYGCKIFMYDPTPASIKFMSQFQSNKLFHYQPIGVWTENTTLKFFQPKYGGSATVINGITSNSNYFEAKCLTIETIMQNNNHKHISIFKADIEGAALPILHQMADKHIFPDQIVAEFERPQSINEVTAFFQDLTNLRRKLSDAGYEEFLLPRTKSKYYSLELLFVNKKKANNKDIEDTSAIV